MSSDILRKMINDAPQQVNDIESSISQIDEQITGLQIQIDALTNEMCSVAEANQTDYLNNTKLPELEASYGTGISLPFTVSYGSNYGTIDYNTGGLIDFQVIDATGGVVYAYEGNHWDGDSTIVKLVDDFDFANDYLTRPLESGATYGLIPAKTNLLFAKGLLQDNQDKIQDSIISLEDYAS